MVFCGRPLRLAMIMIPDGGAFPIPSHVTELERWSASSILITFRKWNAAVDFRM